MPEGKVYISKCMRKDLIFSRLTGPLDKTTPGQIVSFRNHMTKEITDPDLCAEIEDHIDFGIKFWLSAGSQEEGAIAKSVGTQYTDGPMTTASTRGAGVKDGIVNPPAKGKKGKK